MKKIIFLKNFFKRIVFDPIIKDPNKLEDKIAILLKDPQIYLKKTQFKKRFFSNLRLALETLLQS